MFDFDRAPIGVRRLRYARDSMDGARVQVRDIDSFALVLLGGEVGVWNRANVLAAIMASVEGSNAVILSLESCDYFSKRSASLLLDLRERLGRGLVIVCDESVRRLLSIARIDDIIPVTSSVHAARELLLATFRAL